MIAEADLTRIADVEFEPSGDLFTATEDGRPRARSGQSGLQPMASMTQCAATLPGVGPRAAMMVAEAAPLDVSRYRDDGAWLFHPEANAATLGWTAAGGLGANLGRPEPVIQDAAEEFVNTVSHALGLVLSLVGLYAMMQIARMGAPLVPAAGCATYGISMVFLYAASTLYHARKGGKGKRVLLLLDYIGIYLLIAGTYTPMVIINLGGPIGWALLAGVWGIAAVGTCVKVGRFDRFDNDSPIPYVVMGGIWLVAFRQVISSVPTVEFLWVLAGAAFYVAGLAFYIRSDRRFFHSMWHVFVLAGSICHYRAIVGCLNTLVG